MIKFHIKTFETYHIKHKNKRHLARERREIAKNALRHMKPKRFKVEEAKKFMDNSDIIPSLLSNSVVYKTARQEILDQDLKLENYPGNPIESLHEMMDDISAVKMISTYPLIVMYWTEEQIKLWNEANELDEVDISIDASGSFIKRVKIVQDNYSSDLFLYVIVVRFGGKIFLVAQMISESHNTNTITLFMMTTKVYGAPSPKIILADCSLALLNSICLAYNSCFYNEYLLNCFKILNGEESVLPVCLVKRDRNHLMKNVTHWKCFNGKDWRVKDFYSRCIAYALQVTNLELLETVLSSILIVAQSEAIDVSSECYKRYQWLVQKIETFNYDSLYEEETFGVNQYHKIQLLEIEDCKQVPDNILKYIYNINEKCQLLASQNESDFPKPNFLECPGIVNNIVSLFSQFPSWTNVMHSYYPTAKDITSSTGSECYFRIMRNEFAMEHPRSVNRFILNHLTFIEGDTKIGRGMLKDRECTEVENKNLSDRLNSIQLATEPIESRTSQTNNISKDHRSFNNRGVILNGLKLPKITVNNQKYQLTNTCPFDCNAELIVAGYGVQMFRDRVDEFLETNENTFLQMIRDYTESEYLLEPLYIKHY